MTTDGEPREAILEQTDMLALAGSTDLFLRAKTPAFRRVTLALVAAGFSTYALLYCVQPLLPVFSQDLGVSPSVSSLSLSATTGTLAFAMLLAGRISDVRGRKPIMTVSLFAVGILTVACAFAPNWTVLLVVRALTGVALAGVPAVAMAYLAEEVHPRDLGGAMGLYIAGNAYGGMAGRVLTGVLIDATHSWRIAVGVMGLFGLAAAALFLTLLPPSRRFEPEHGVSVGDLGRTFAGHLRDPVLAKLFLVGFLLMGGFVTTYNYLSYRLIEPPFDLSQAFAGAIFLVYLLGGPASAWFGRLGGRHGRGRMMIAAMALMLAGLVLTAAPSLVLSIAAIAIFTSGFFGAHSIASGWVSRRAETARAAAASLYLFAYYAGSSLFGSLGGRVLVALRLGWDHGSRHRSDRPRFARRLAVDGSGGARTPTCRLTTLEQARLALDRRRRAPVQSRADRLHHIGTVVRHLVHGIVDRYEAQQVVLGRLEQSHGRICVALVRREPLFERGGLDDRGQAGMDGDRDAVGARRDDASRVHLFSVRAHPGFPEAGKRHRLPVRTATAIGLRTRGFARARPTPFVEGVCRHEAAATAKRVSKAYFLVETLGAGIEDQRKCLRVLHEAWQKGPAR